MKIINKLVADLIPYVNNARTHSDQQIAQIASSIKEFGFCNPVLIDGQNGIIAGHGRVLAAQKLGLKEVPTIELSHLTDTQRKAYILADNRLAELSGWDDELLKLELTGLELLEFDLALIGFDGFYLASDDKDSSSEEERMDYSESLNDKFSIIVNCSSETQQQDVFNYLNELNIECRVLSI